MCVKFESYKDYCVDRQSKGLQVLPETLWNALKEDDDGEE